MFNDTVSLFISDVKKPPDVLKAMVWLWQSKDHLGRITYHNDPHKATVHRFFQVTLCQLWKFGCQKLQGLRALHLLCALVQKDLLRLELLQLLPGDQNGYVGMKSWRFRTYFVVETCGNLLDFETQSKSLSKEGCPCNMSQKTSTTSEESPPISCDSRMNLTCKSIHVMLGMEVQETLKLGISYGFPFLDYGL